MTKEDYVSLEVAKKLMNKGFDEPCDKMLNEHEECYEYSCYTMSRKGFRNSDLCAYEVAIPTLYDAQKWLREKHNIDVLPTIREESLPKKDYCCYIYKDAKVVHCKVAYGDDFYECMNDSLLESINYI